MHDENSNRAGGRDWSQSRRRTSVEDGGRGSEGGGGQRLCFVKGNHTQKERQTPETKKRKRVKKDISRYKRQRTELNWYVVSLNFSNLPRHFYIISVLALSEEQGKLSICIRKQEAKSLYKTLRVIRNEKRKKRK
jgi:hypothetical protein